jgi:hypothetical protein
MSMSRRVFLNPVTPYPKYQNVRIGYARLTMVHPPSSIVVYMQGRESGGPGFETCSGVIHPAALLKCGHNPSVD